MATQMYYISTDLDRWDSLAFDFYGDASMVEPLLQANPSLAFFTVLPLGKKIIIPQVSVVSQSLTSVKAPWK